MKKYISGPNTGTTDYLERFELAEKTLEKWGHEVVNPAKVNRGLPKGTTYDEYMKMSYTMLEMCDLIFLLDGWQQSKGANLEVQHALKYGISIAQEGGKTCQKSQNKQKLENSPMLFIKRLFRETTKNVFSVK